MRREVAHVGCVSDIMTALTPFVHIDKHGIVIEPLLRRLLERVAADARFREDLDLCGFQPHSSPSDEIDCLNPWLFVIAMNGGGSAYGLYVHPDAIREGVAPWAFWEHEDDSIFLLAPDTDHLLRGLVAFVESYHHDHDQVARVRAVLAELGVRIDGERVERVELDFDSERPNAAWLPPAREELEDVASYLAMLESDPARAELGLLGHCHFNQDRAAREALDARYAARGISPPRSCDD